jgi:hypothetical protein
MQKRELPQISTFYGTLFLCVLATLVAALVLIAPRLRDPNEDLQPLNLVLAEQYIRKISPTLQKDTRFRGVEAVIFTGLNGSVVIRGRVASDTDFLALKRIIMQNPPQITVAFEISVGNEGQMRGGALHYTLP